MNPAPARRGWTNRKEERVRILDRYLIKGFLLPLLYCIITFLFLYVIVDLFGHLDEILKQRVSLNMLFFYYLCFLPAIFVQTAPIAALLSVMYILGSLDRHNEITAMKASGISTFRIIMPFLAMGLVISLAVFFINENVVPATGFVTTKIKEENIEKSKRVEENKIINNLTFYGKRNSMIYAKTFDMKNNTLYDVVVLEHDRYQKVKRKLIADNAQWLDGKWHFNNCSIYIFGPSGQIIKGPWQFKTKIINLQDSPRELIKFETQADFMNYAQLKNYIDRLSASGSNKTVIKLLVDLYFKLAFPFVSLIIMLLGIPFALKMHGSKSGTLFSMGSSIGIALFYYGITAVSLALGKGGFLPPILAAWLSNIIFGLWGICSIYRLW